MQENPCTLFDQFNWNTGGAFLSGSCPVMQNDLVVCGLPSDAFGSAIDNQALRGFGINRNRIKGHSALHMGYCSVYLFIVNFINMDDCLQLLHC